MLIEAGNRGNILDYTVWSPGTSGAEQGFSVNGAALENYRVIDTGPQGSKITVWEARPDSSGNADGGWNTNSIPIDNTKMYRFSVWIRRTVQGNGTAYLGVNAYGSSNGVLNRSNASNNTNPYFFTSSTPSPTTGEWSLWVGHVWPKGSGTGGQHPDSGRYTVENGRIGNISQDFVWLEETTTARHRSYLYYATNAETRQQFCYPRVDLCDGSEPTIEDLLSGIDERWEGEEFPTTISIRENMVTPNSSEVGITRGLVAWYPLIGDTLDYAGTNHAINNGAVATAEGYEFDGGEHLLTGFTPGESTLGQRFTWTWCDRPSRFASNTGSHGNAGSPRFYKQWADSSGAMRVAVGDSFWTAIPSNNIPLGEWSFFAVVFDEGEVRTYLNGQLQDTASGVVFSGESSSAFSVGRGFNGERHYEGVSRDHRIYNTALTPEEVAIQAKLALNPETKSVMTQNCLYTKGQIKEVIA